jgi:hypothetical protein
MPKKQAKNTDIVTWQDNASNGFTRGIISHNVPRPHFIEISPNGKWLLLTIDDDDQPVHIAGGKAKDIARAKAEVRAHAITKIPSLKAAIKEVEEAEQPEKTPVLISARRATVRMYAALTAAVLWVGWGFYWFARIRPKTATLTIIIVAVAAFAATKIIDWLDDKNAKRVRLIKRQQAEQMVKAAQAQRQPAMRR